MIGDILFYALGLAGLAILIAAALSPLETLTWWAGWTEDELSQDTPPPNASAAEPEQAAPDSARHYVVYLSGVASISGEYLLRRERIFLDRLRAAAPEAIIIADIFPYSPAGVPLLAAPRIFDRLWRWLQKLQLEERRPMLRTLINVRNVYQVMVSADHRYGPIFSQGAAIAIEKALAAQGYRRHPAARVTIIGYSGGAQVAVGAAPFLKARIGAAIEVVSIGGVIASDPGLNVLSALHHLRGDRDRVEKVGAVMFAGRWKLFANSHWNVAKRHGVVKMEIAAGSEHAGPRGYFGLPKIDGVAPGERTAQSVVAILNRDIGETGPPLADRALP